MKNKKPKAAKPKPQPKANHAPVPLPYVKHLEWTDKQLILQHFFLSDRTLQNLRDVNAIVWSNIGSKLYYHLPSFVALLEKNKRGPAEA